MLIPVDADLWGLLPHAQYQPCQVLWRRDTSEESWGVVLSCGQLIACHQGQAVSQVWAPCPRSHEHTGKWCDRWRICHIQQCCRSPSWSIPWGSDIGMKMISEY